MAAVERNRHPTMKHQIVCPCWKENGEERNRMHCPLLFSSLLIIVMIIHLLVFCQWLRQWYPRCWIATYQKSDRSETQGTKTSQAHQAKVRTVMAVGQVSVSRRVSTSVLMVLFLVVRNNSRNWWLENVYSFRQPILGNDNSLPGIRI